MTKENLIVFDIDDTLTKSENQHLTAYVKTMNFFGITNINTDWKTYKNLTDSYILKVNYECNLNKKFDISFVDEFEKKMIEILLTLPKTEEIKGALNIVDFFLKETNYAVCFATGSLLEPAIIKLKQARVVYIPEVLEASNTIYTREDIVTSAIEKAQQCFNVNSFKNIISVGDGIWDLKTAKNLGVHFLGIRNKNLKYFKEYGIKSHIENWSNFDFNKVQKELEII